jgi:hypothetical protein
MNSLFSEVSSFGEGLQKDISGLNTLGKVGLTASVFGAAMGIGSAYFTAKTQKKVLEGQARLSALNAQMAEFSASQAIEAGVKRQEAYSMQAGAIKSKTKTQLASRGFVLSGTASDILSSQDYVSQVEKLNIERDALNQAFGLKTKALNEQAQAIGQKFTAESISPFMSVTSQSLKSGSDLISQYALMKNLGGGANMSSLLSLLKE